VGVRLGVTLGLLACAACTAPAPTPSTPSVPTASGTFKAEGVPGSFGPLSGAKWYVGGVRGSNQNDCKSPKRACKTIGHAMSLTSPGDSIIVAAATYPENLNVRHSMQIIGAGAARTIVDARHLASAFLITHNGSVVTISGMTMRNAGGLGDGGGIYNCFTTLTIVNSVIKGSSVRKGNGAAGFGGAIYNCPGSTLTIIDSLLTGNTAEQGGGICNGGALTIINTTFSNNTAREHKGGGIRNYGTLTIANSTFTGNSAEGGVGGGIHNGYYIGGLGTLVMSNSTVSGNSAGGVFNLRGSTATLQNTIVSHNMGGDCRGPMTSNGYNLSSDDTCTFGSTGDMNGTDPRLGSLHDNGGPTPTMALFPHSPAIDAGNPNGCTDGQGHLLKSDQRGKPRPDAEDAGGCDIGAYERQ
jgi:predicted outer membrane repeat protein